MGFQTCRNLSVFLLAGVAFVGCNNPDKPKTVMAPSPSPNMPNQGQNAQLQNQGAFPRVSQQGPVTPAGLQPYDPSARTTVPPSQGFTPSTPNGLPMGPQNLPQMPGAPPIGSAPTGLPMSSAPLPGSSMPSSPPSGLPFSGQPMPVAPTNTDRTSPPLGSDFANPAAIPIPGAPSGFPGNR
jgi:hypothetical protein